MKFEEVDKHGFMTPMRCCEFEKLIGKIYDESDIKSCKDEAILAGLLLHRLSARLAEKEIKRRIAEWKGEKNANVR